LTSESDEPFELTLEIPLPAEWSDPAATCDGAEASAQFVDLPGGERLARFAGVSVESGADVVCAVTAEQ